MRKAPSLTLLWPPGLRERPVQYREPGLNAPERRHTAFWTEGRGNNPGPKTYESWIEGCTDAEYAAWHTFAIELVGEDGLFGGERDRLLPVWERFRAL